MTHAKFSLRVALSSLSLIALVGSVACSSAPEAGESTESGDQAMSIWLPFCPANYARVCAPGYQGLCPCQPEIQVEATAPDPNGPDPGCTLSSPLPVPPELAGKNCTLGTLYNGGQRIWACPAGTPAPKTIAWPEATYGYLITIDLGSQGRSAFDSQCLGYPMPPFPWSGGWEYIVQTELVINHSCGGGCPGPGF